MPAYNATMEYFAAIKAEGGSSCLVAARHGLTGGKQHSRSLGGPSMHAAEQQQCFVEGSGLAGPQSVQRWATVLEAVAHLPQVCVAAGDTRAGNTSTNHSNERARPSGFAA